jgi:DNA invertase Pin-like site-specific DNA recombinase
MSKNKKDTVAVAYCRVSTADQSTQIQRDEIEAFISARGWSLSAVFEDKRTGTTANRTNLNRLMDDARQRKMDVIVCWKIDRLFRSLKHLVVTLQEWDELGIKFVSLKDNLDLSTSQGRLMMQIIGAFAEFESSLIRERVTAGVRAKISQTGKWGRTSNRDDQKIQQLNVEGNSNRAIARTLSVSEATVRRSLKGASSPSKNRDRK